MAFGCCGQRLPQLKLLAADTEDKSRWRRDAFGLYINLQYGFWRQFVRGVGDPDRRRAVLEGVGRACIGTGINEQGKLAPGQIKHVLDLQLEILDQFKLLGQALGVEPVGQAIEQHRPDSVIATARIADGEDDNRCTHERLSE